MAEKKFTVLDLLDLELSVTMPCSLNVLRDVAVSLVLLQFQKLTDLVLRFPAFLKILQATEFSFLDAAKLHTFTSFIKKKIQKH